MMDVRGRARDFIVKLRRRAVPIDRDVGPGARDASHLGFWMKSDDAAHGKQTKPVTAAGRIASPDLNAFEAWPPTGADENAFFGSGQRVAVVAVNHHAVNVRIRVAHRRDISAELSCRLQKAKDRVTRIDFALHVL